MAAVVAGSSLTLQTTLVDSETGQPLSLTGVSATCKLRSPSGVQTAVPGVVSNAGQGVVSASLTSSDLQESGQYAYQWVLAYPGGSVVSSEQGTIVVQPPLW